ncbi:hypothetical protein FKG94_22280 [Exilibacterium tricleocarpae]|uniref:Uncharacterized protein n=1 Tax=Exilibacterium tricleocarpae TaxID=2591008 RepID=A0A545SY48_9GAMM|nr:hypothetical protein [Exilibacterium tricleocarpae]TQV69883.1 hypothetical protein FKG94_22280 [Exilibacterium tricleocarpae]
MSDGQGTEVIRVATIGMDENGKSRMSLIFKTHYKGRCALSAIDNAHVLLVDTHAKSSDELTKLQEFIAGGLKIPYIILGKKLDADPDAICVAHPPKLNLLWDCIAEQTGSRIKDLGVAHRNGLLRDLKSINLKTSTSPKAAESARSRQASTLIRDAELGGFQGNAKTFFQPDDFLLGRLQKTIEEARRRSSSLQLKCWDNRRIIVYPKSGYVLSDLKPAQLKNLGLVQMVNSTTIEITSFDDNALHKLSECDVNEVWVLPIEVLLWNLALRTSRGRLPQGTSLTKRYRLLRWPNFTRMDQFPNCMRIASAWINKAATLGEIAAGLGVDEKYINLFYTGALAINLIDNSEQGTEHTTNTTMTTKKRTLFTAILNNLAAHRSRSKERL